MLWYIGSVKLIVGGNCYIYATVQLITNNGLTTVHLKAGTEADKMEFYCTKENYHIWIYISFKLLYTGYHINLCSFFMRGRLSIESGKYCLCVLYKWCVKYDFIVFELERG